MRREFTKAVKRDAFMRADGKCEGSLPNGSRCNCKLTVGKMTYDHRVPDWMGGEPTLENCQVLCQSCDKAKTRQDAADRGHTRRLEDAHRGITDPHRRTMKGAGFKPAPKQRSASRPVAKWSLIGRQMP